MKLNKQKGNMYDFITHTGNIIKGECFHDCSYCYMKRWGSQKIVRFDEKELKIGMGSGKFIFVGSSCDMFAENIPDEWILKTLKHCQDHNNKYLFQTKNPERFLDYIGATVISDKSVLCTTIESNKWYPGIMGKSPGIISRAKAMHEVSQVVDTYVTVEPILDFDLDAMVDYISFCRPVQVNIGADTGGHKMPEPGKEKILELITELEKITKVKLKKNLNRLMR